MTIAHIAAYRVEEPLLGTLDYIPLVSEISGAARFAFGCLEVTLGIPAFPIQLIMRVLNDRSRFLFNLGISNIVRGSIAAIPIGGNIAMYMYDHMPHTKSDVQDLFGLKVYQ